jgi:hypothetical protein
MRQSLRLPFAALMMATACGLVAAGCADRNADVRGSVRGLATFEGEPLANGSITFEPTAGTRGAIAGGEIVGGRYHIPTAIGPAIGTNLVRVSVMGLTGRTVRGPGGQLGDEIAETLPAHCNTASTLQVEIKKGRNELNLDLRSKPE